MANPIFSDITDLDFINLDRIIWEGEAGSASESPSLSPSKSPSLSPSESPSVSPSLSPSESPSKSPSISPSESPSEAPSNPYSRGNYASLPSNDDDLETIYSAGDITAVGTDDANYVSQVGTSEYMIHQYKDNASNKNKVTIQWKGKTSLSPISSTVFLQIYNHNTTTWTTVDSENSSDPNNDFNLEAEINGLTAYKDTDNYISCRVYQQAI